MTRAFFETISERTAVYRNERFSGLNFVIAENLPKTSFLNSEKIYDRRLPETFRMLLVCYSKDGTECNIGRELNLKVKLQLPKQGVFHKHSFIEILYVVEGSFDQILLGERRHFEQGTVVVTDQNCEHADYIEAKDASVLFLQISSDLLDRLLKAYDTNDTLGRFLFHSIQTQKREQSFLELHLSVGQQTAVDNRISAGSDRTLERILELLFEEELARAAGFPQVRDGFLIRLLHHLCLDYSQELHSNDHDGKEKKILYEVERYIRLHADTVTSCDLENHFHYHRNYYNLLLQKYRAMSFKKYVQKIRMENAKQLLGEKNLPVKEVARRCGYENTSHFYHLYEEMFGEKP